MTDQNLLSSVKSALDRGDITVGDLKAIMRDRKDDHDDRNLALSRIFSYIGAALILMGVIFLVYLNWSRFVPLARILVTLGGSVVAYILGIVILMTKSQRIGQLPQALLLIGVILFPIGLSVLMYEAGIDIGTAGAQSIISVCSTVLVAGSYLLTRHFRVFLVVGIGFATWFLFALATFLTDGGQRLMIESYTFYRWLTLVVGVIYLLAGVALLKRKGKDVSGLLFAFGSIGIFTVALTGGWGWDIIFPLLVALGAIGSVYLKSRSILVVSSIALIAYLVKITAEYFSDVLAAWPIALIALGGLIIGVSYGAYRIHLYIKSRTKDHPHEISNRL